LFDKEITYYICYPIFKQKTMKKIYFIGALMATAMSFGQQALPFFDTFSYPAANLHETAPWSALGTPSASDHILLDGSKVTFAAGGTDAQVLVASQTSGTVYYKFDLKVITMAGVTDANGGYLAGFTQNATTFGASLWTKRGADDNTYNLGIETRTATAANTTFTSGTYNAGTTYTVVVGYTFNPGANDDTTKLWVNPGAGEEATPLLTDTHTGTDLPAIVSFFLRQDSATETPSVEIDNLRVATTFADVLSNNTPNSISGLKVYPNPAKNNLYISSDSFAEKQVELYDVLGKVALKTKVTNTPINLSGLTSGVYVVKVTEEGKTATRKIVIE
jgi:hypothetical protein